MSSPLSTITRRSASAVAAKDDGADKAAAQECVRQSAKRKEGERKREWKNRKQDRVFSRGGCVRRRREGEEVEICTYWAE